MFKRHRDQAGGSLFGLTGLSIALKKFGSRSSHRLGNMPVIRSYACICLAIA